MQSSFRTCRECRVLGFIFGYIPQISTDVKLLQSVCQWIEDTFGIGAIMFAQMIVFELSSKL